MKRYDRILYLKLSIFWRFYVYARSEGGTRFISLRWAIDAYKSFMTA